MCALAGKCICILHRKGPLTFLGWAVGMQYFNHQCSLRPSQPSLPALRLPFWPLAISSEKANHKMSWGKCQRKVVEDRPKNDQSHATFLISLAPQLASTHLSNMQVNTALQCTTCCVRLLEAEHPGCSGWHLTAGSYADCNSWWHPMPPSCMHCTILFKCERPRLSGVACRAWQPTSGGSLLPWRQVAGGNW